MCLHFRLSVRESIHPSIPSAMMSAVFVIASRQRRRLQYFVDGTHFTRHNYDYYKCQSMSVRPLLTKPSRVDARQTKSLNIRWQQTEINIEWGRRLLMVTLGKIESQIKKLKINQQTNESIKRTLRQFARLSGRQFEIVLMGFSNCSLKPTVQ